MQSLTYRNGRLVPKHDGRTFLIRIFSAHLRGLTPDQFAEEELERMRTERGEFDLPDEGRSNET